MSGIIRIHLERFLHSILSRVCFHEAGSLLTFAKVVVYGYSGNGYVEEWVMKSMVE